MDRRITSRLNMANTYQTVCANNTTTVNTVPAFAALLLVLGTMITSLRNLMQKVSTKTGGDALDKTNWKEELSLYLAVVCGAGVSYSKKVKDVVLEEKFSYAESILSGKRDTELIATANSIIALQATVAAQLQDYGITSTEMDALNNALENFEAKNSTPIVNVVTGEIDRKLALDKAFELSDFILNDMMKAALIFKLKAPEFYALLKKASLIRNQGLRHELSPEEAAANKEERRLKKEAKAKEAAVKEAAAKEAAAKLKEAAEKKEVTESPNPTELLGTNVEEMNATTENIETPTLPEPSQNGH